MLSKQRFSKIYGLSVLLLLLVLVGCGGTPTAGQVDQQAEETASSSSAQEHRIVSTTVAVTEIMDALEIDLVGVPTSTKTLPARYDGLTPIGNPMSPDMEVVKSLRPTEVLSVSTLQYDLQPTFEKFGIKADFLNLQSLGNMEETITRLGQTYDREEQATALISRYEEKRAQIEQAVAGKEKPKVLILLGVPGSYLVATENSFIGDLVKLAGERISFRTRRWNIWPPTQSICSRRILMSFCVPRMVCLMRSSRCSTRSSQPMISGSISVLFRMVGYMIWRKVYSELQPIWPLIRHWMSCRRCSIRNCRCIHGHLLQSRIL